MSSDKVFCSVLALLMTRNGCSDCHLLQIKDQSFALVSLSLLSTAASPVQLLLFASSFHHSVA